MYVAAGGVALVSLVFFGFVYGILWAHFLAEAYLNDIPTLGENQKKQLDKIEQLEAQLEQTGHVHLPGRVSNMTALLTEYKETLDTLQALIQRHTIIIQSNTNYNQSSQTSDPGTP